MTDNTTEVVTYAGRRTLVGGKIGYAYQDAAGELRFYGSALVAAPIGTLVTITHPEDELSSYYSKGPNAPRATGFDEDRDLTDWQTADRAAYQSKADADSIKRASKRAVGMDSHIDALTSAASKLTGYERAAFARYVADRIRGL